MHLFAVSIVVAVSLACLACSGTSSSDGGYQSPPPASDPKWDTVAAIIDKDCASCHDGAKEPSLKPAATFKASPAAAKLKAGLMPPPPRTISDGDKATLLSYLGG